MSRSRMEFLVASVVACILALNGFACQDQGGGVVPMDIAGMSFAANPSIAEVVAGQSGGPSVGVTKQGGAPGENAAGACSREDRQRYAHNPSLKFKEQLRVCGKETWADKEDNTACLSKVVPGLSKSCLACFTDMASCAFHNCKGACMFDSKSEGCEKCANSHCQAHLVKCTGVASGDLP